MSANGKQPARTEKRRSSDGTSSASKRRSLGGRTGIEGLLVQRSFKNTLPDIPPVPKFLALPFLDTSRFVEYQHTTLEKAHKNEIHVGKDLGVHVELIDTAVYEGGEHLQMHPKDEALLKDAPTRSRSEGTGEHVDVPWLRSTTYIATDNRSYGRDATDWSENKVLGGHVVTEEIEEYKSREAQIEAIEATFDAAARDKLVHPDNPNLTAVEVTPILPSREFWGRPFLHGTFDNDPTPSLKSLEKVPATVRRKYLGQGMLSQREDEGATLADFSLYLPQQATFQRRRLIQAGEAEDIAVGESYTFDKVRDYVLELKDNEGDDTYVLATSKGKTLYKSFQGRVKLNRRRRERRGRREGKVTLSVTHRDATEAELAEEREQCVPLFYTEIETAEGDGDGDGDLVEEAVMAPPEGEAAAAAASDDDDDDSVDES
mmetsp:Transcript_10503/g.27000  ORF Transcript_10503/g.27000 Transcript_10503/m.27000 type:complete len:431 (-) Transcript_10503:1077-2369(-)